MPTPQNVFPQESILYQIWPVFSRIVKPDIRRKFTGSLKGVPADAFSFFLKWEPGCDILKENAGG